METIMSDVIVIGGGAVGLAVARELAHDHSVLVLERGLPGQQASWAAAGMLCPCGEASQDDALFRLGLAGLSMYPPFLNELNAETGIDVEYDAVGTLVLASTAQEWAELSARWEWQNRAGLPTRRFSAGEVRDLEPSLELPVHGALFCPGDHRLDPRRLLQALRKSCAIRGVEIVTGAPVAAITCARGRVSGVRAGVRAWTAGQVIVAAGSWSGRLAGLRPPVCTRPRKGQILALETPVRFRHAVRWRQHYIVPRRDGRLVVGATNEDCGFDRTLTAAGVSGLLEAALQMAPQLASAVVLDAWTGLRPETQDGLPCIGRAEPEGLVYAFGNYRNGILQAPATAAMVGEAIRGGAGSRESPFSPMRFARNPSLATHV
jgi:glycine oxidase